MADRPVADGSGAAEGVVLVHGLWMTGVELLPMSRRLRSRGFRTHLFPLFADRCHATGARPPPRRLRGAARPRPVHWVAHSYGGIVALHCLALGLALPPGG